MLFKNVLPLAAVAAAAAPVERLFSTIQPSQDEILAEQQVAQTNHITSNVEGSVFNRFVVIWLENTDFDKAAESDGLHWLAQYGVTLDNYWAVTHPSEPNYAAAAGGDYFGIEDDNFNRFPSNVSTVADLLDTKQISWAEYQEHLPYSGYDGFEYLDANGANDYVRKHSPLSMYDSVTQVADRAANLKNFTMFYEDLENEVLPQWMFITPNMTNDGHDSTIDVAATWSKNFLEPLLCNEYFMKDTLILLTFDETETYTIQNKVFALLLGGAVPESLQGTVDSTFYEHYSEISTVEVNWDLPNLGRHDADANVFQLVADQTGTTNVEVDTTGRANNLSYVGWISDDTQAFPAPNVNAIGMNGQGVLDSIKSLWADTYTSQLNASYFTATTTTSMWSVPDATVNSAFLIQTPSPLDCPVSSSSDFMSSEEPSSSESSSAVESSTQSSVESTSASFESSSAVESSTQSFVNSTSTYTDDEQSTTVITVTSCSDNACSEVPVTTGVTVITETSEGVVTEFTTYCPLTGETSSVAPATEASSSEAVTETTEAATETEAATSETTTEAATSEATEQTTEAATSEVITSEEAATTSEAPVSTEAAISTYEGKAAGLALGTTVVGVVLSLLMF